MDQKFFPDGSSSENPTSAQGDFPPIAPNLHVPLETLHPQSEVQGSSAGSSMVPQNTDDSEHHGMPAILKIILGFIVVGVLGVLFFGVILPMFSKGSQGKVNLTYWGLWEDPAVMAPILEKFEKEHPNIHVEYVKQDPKQYSERLLTRIANGTGPDVFRFHTSWLPMLQQDLVPLPSTVVSKQELAKYYPVVQTDLVRNGALYGVPLYVDTLALFVNDSLLKAAGVSVPKTWNDFVAAARTLTVKDSSNKIKTSGAAIGTYNNIPTAPDIVSLLFFQNGANVTNLASTPQNGADALTFYTSFAKDAGNVWDDTLESPLVGFAKGNVAMYFGYSYDVFAIKAINPTLQFSVYPVPHLPGRDMTVASYFAEGVSSKGKHQTEALQFVKYLSQNDTLQTLYSNEAKTRAFGELYPKPELADSLLSNPLAAPFVQQSKNAVSSIFPGNTYDTSGIDAQMNGYLGNAVRSVLGNTSAQSAVETLSKGVSTVLQQYAGKPQ